MNPLSNYYHYPDVSYNNGKARQAILQEKAIQLETKHLDMIRSIEYASRIQDAMLPSGELFDTFFSDYFILSKPKEIVSGDFCWMKEMNNKLIFTLADSTGHGVPGAFISILGIMLLEQITSLEKVIQADEILNILKARVSQAMHHNKKGGEMKEGLDLTLCVYDPAEMKLQFSGAMDRIYMVRDHSLTRLQLNQFYGNLQMDHEIPYEMLEINVRRGDMFYLFTDGFPDQFGGEKNKKFTIKRFQELLMKICKKKMVRQKQILDDTVTKWQGAIEQLDDITVMGILF